MAILSRKKRPIWVGSGGGGGLPIPAAPTLTAPADSAVLTDTTPDFSWGAVTGAATYDIEIRETLTGTPTATGIVGTTYTPGVALDATLTYSWRVRGVNAGGVAGAWSSTLTFAFTYYADTVTITPSLGEELVTNGTFDAWTGDNPNGWSIAGESGGNEVTQRSPLQTHADSPAGTGAANIYTTGSAVVMTGPTISLTGWYKAGQDITAIAAGSIKNQSGAVDLISWTTIGTKAFTFRAPFTDFRITRNSGATDVTVDNATCKAISAMTQLFTHALPYGKFSVKGTSAANYQFGVVFNYTDANNYALLNFNRINGRVYLVKVAGGTLTDAGNWAATYVADAVLTARRLADGTIDVIYNGTALASGVAATGLTGVQGGPFLTDAANVSISQYEWNALVGF